MEANTPKNEPPPTRRDPKGWNRVPSYEEVYACDWRVDSVPTVYTAMDPKYQAPHRRTIRDATLTFPGAYIG